MANSARWACWRKTLDKYLAGTLLPQLPPGYCVSLDALHTTAATARTLVEAEHYYRLPVKQNRAHTPAAIEVIATTVPPDSEATEVDESHGRHVQRHTQVFPPSAA